MKVVTYQSHIDRYARISVTPRQEELLVEHGAWPYGYAQVYFGLHDGVPSYTDEEIREMCGIPVPAGELLAAEANQLIDAIAVKAGGKKYKYNYWQFTASDDDSLLRFWERHQLNCGDYEYYYIEYPASTVITKLREIAAQHGPWHEFDSAACRMVYNAMQQLCGDRVGESVISKPPKDWRRHTGEHSNPWVLDY